MGSRCDTEEGHVLVLVLTEIIILPYVVGDGDGDALHLHYHLLPHTSGIPWGSGRAHLTPELIYRQTGERVTLP